MNPSSKTSARTSFLILVSCLWILVSQFYDDATAPTRILRTGAQPLVADGTTQTLTSLCTFS